MQFKSHISELLTILRKNRILSLYNNQILMKVNLTLLISFLLVSSYGYSQGQQSANEYDFWVGDWTATWIKKDGTKIQGTNRIEKTLDGKVLQEHFHDPSTNFKGTSISVFNPVTKVWHQAWADNQGGYYNFIGETLGDKRIFKTLPKTKGTKVIVQRMVFYNITEQSMTWDWESSNDGGLNWNLNWRIEYTRNK